MLTRIEIDGFKSFEDFALDLQPFTVIFGANGVGKSNLFNAMGLLSRLASTDLASAFAGLDGAREGTSSRGDPMEQFRKTPAGVSPEISIAVEVLLPRHVKDPHGGATELSQTRIRYEIRIEWRQESGRERLIVVHEAARPIRKDTDRWTPSGQPVGRAFEDAFILRRRKSDFISTQQEGGHAVLLLHQEGRQGRKRPADTVSATVLSSVTTTDFPHLYALKEELRAIHFLHLSPEALREPSPLMAPDLLMPDGRNIASVLARIERETSDETYPRGELTSIRNALTTLVPGLRDVQVRYDETERRHRIEFTTTDGLGFSARVASDGTLRMLALVAMVHDPRCPGVICFEEPENGVHKARLVTLVDILRRSCTDPLQKGFEPDERLRQILLNTHSPVVAGSLVPHRHDIVVAESATRQSDGQSRRRTAMRTYKTASQGGLALADGPPTLSDFEIGRLADRDDASAT